VRFAERLVAGLGEAPNVRSVGLATLLPADGCALERLETEGAPAQRGGGVGACVVGVAGDYLETLAVPLLAGRPFTADEWRQGSVAVVISAGLARRLWPDGPAIGKRLRVVGDEHAGWREVVGVVGDVSAPRDMVVDARDPGVQLYDPYAVAPDRRIAAVVATAAPASELAATFRREVRRAGASVPLGEVLTLERSVANAQWVSRFFSEQLVLYATAALVIAVFGLYGLVSDAVTRSRFELAMRLALGASREQVLALVARRGSWMVGGGILGGLLLGLVVSRLGASMLGGSSPHDLPIYLLVVIVLGLAAGIATWLPARRAARLDPARLLRSE